MVVGGQKRILKYLKGDNMSKGSTPRPHDVDKFQENFEKIFGKKREAKKIDITKLKNVWEEKSTKQGKSDG